MDYFHESQKFRERISSLFGVNIENIKPKFTNCILLRYLPEYELNRDICEQAIKENFRAIQFVPKIFLLEDLCWLALEISYIAIRYIPHSAMIEDMAVFALEEYIAAGGDGELSGSIIHWIPSKCQGPEFRKIYYQYKYRDYEVADISLVTHDEWIDISKIDSLAIIKMPIKFLTPSMFYASIQSNGSQWWKAEMFQNLPDQTTKAILIEACRQNRDIEVTAVPKSLLQDKEILDCWIANPKAICYKVPTEWYNLNLFKKLVREDSYFIKAIPRDHLTPEILAIALKKEDLETSKDRDLYCSTPKYITGKITREILEFQGKSVWEFDWTNRKDLKQITDLVVEYFITYAQTNLSDLNQESFNNNYSYSSWQNFKFYISSHIGKLFYEFNLKAFPEEIITEKIVRLSFQPKNYNQLKWVPKEFWNHEIYILSLNSCSDNIQYIPENQLREEYIAITCKKIYPKQYLPEGWKHLADKYYPYRTRVGPSTMIKKLAAELESYVETSAPTEWTLIQEIYNKINFYLKDCGFGLEHISHEHQNSTMIKVALSDHSFAIKYLAPKFQTNEYLLEPLRKYPHSLSEVLEPYQTMEMAQTSKVIQYISPRHIQACIN